MSNAVAYLSQLNRSEQMLSCYLCGSDGRVKRVYNSSDKYEKLIGINKDVRVWYVCQSCGLTWQTNSLTESNLKDIYSHYRDTSFRNESVKEIFLRIDNLDQKESENEYRFRWFSKHVGIEKGCLLDIGSGFGIWPNVMVRHGWEVVCVEPNEESCKFINEYLNIPCSATYGLEDVGNGYNVISLVHVLEHISNPIKMLKEINERLVKDGRLFVEIPDAMEFDYLDCEHDEFNSTHLFFYDTASIYNLLSRVFDVTDIHRVHHKSRGLYRILALCRKRN